MNTSTTYATHAEAVSAVLAADLVGEPDDLHAEYLAKVTAPLENELFGRHSGMTTRTYSDHIVRLSINHVQSTRWSKVARAREKLDFLLRDDLYQLVFWPWKTEIYGSLATDWIGCHAERSFHDRAYDPARDRAEVLRNTWLAVPAPPMLVAQFTAIAVLWALHPEMEHGHSIQPLLDNEPLRSIAHDLARSLEVVPPFMASFGCFQVPLRSF